MPAPPVLIEASEYEGQAEIRVSCTQLGTSYKPSRARRVVDDWIHLLGAGPTELTSIEFVSRTPSRLFAALAGQTQLQRLAVKWGDYTDLGVLQRLRELRDLQLRGASQVADVSGLAQLTQLRRLALEGFRSIPDTSPLGVLVSLTDLELGGNWATPRNGHLNRIDFLHQLSNLETVLLHTVMVDDRDYSPLLALPYLKSVRVMAVPDMQPSYDDLKSTLPWSD